MAQRRLDNRVPSINFAESALHKLAKTIPPLTVALVVHMNGCQGAHLIFSVADVVLEIW